MLDTFLFPVSIVLVFYGIYKWITLNDDYFIKKNVVHLSPKFLFGNTGKFFMKQVRPNEFFQNLYNSFPKEKIFGIFDFRRPTLVLRDPEMLRQLAIKDFDHFEDHKLLINDDQDVMLGNSLIMLRGNKWREMRATLSPAFTGSKMRLMFDLVGDCAFEMCEHFKKQALSGIALNLEMKDLFTKYTNDVIATAAFGINVNSFENAQNEFYVTGKRMMNFVSLKAAVKLLCMRVVPSLMRALDIQFIDSSAARFFKNLVLETIEVRDKKNIYRPDMINLMMQLKKSGTGASITTNNVEEKESDGFATVEESSIGKAAVKRQWNDDEIVAQCFLFFAAGFDTSSTLLSFASYELATKPDIQEKLYAEIQEVNEQLQGQRIPYDMLQKMKYMDMVISEVLRLWPPAMFTDRLCVKDYEYNDGTRKFVIDKGTTIWVPIYGFHRDEKYFKNPDTFDPERFSDDQKDSIVSGTYLPFGIGPRNCIGSRFALMEVKAVIYYLLLNFKFVPNAKTQIPLILQKNPTGPVPEKGINMQLKLR